MSGTVNRVSTLLMTVGRPHTPASVGKGGLGRGIARRPSSDSISAVSSPRTKPPAPRRISAATEIALPSTRSPTKPASRAWASARSMTRAAPCASPWM